MKNWIFNIRIWLYFKLRRSKRVYGHWPDLPDFQPKVIEKFQSITSLFDVKPYLVSWAGYRCYEFETKEQAEGFAKYWKV